MSYFEVLAWTLGMLNVATVVSYFAAKEKWSAFMLEKLVPKTRPSWIGPAIILAILWVIYTWYQVILMPRAMTYVLALYVTFAVPKLLFTYFQYPHMRTIVEALTGSAQVALKVVLICGLLLGLGFLAIGIYL